METQHFKKSELCCKCCGIGGVKSELVAVLELVRLRFNKPVIVTSPFRCLDHNKAVGGKPNSKHVLGKAADIVVKDVDPKEVYDFLVQTFPKSYGIGKYATFTHIDIRVGMARW